MTLQQVKEQLDQLDSLQFQLPDGSIVPQHFHVTEVGEVTKHFIDCGGTMRHEKKVNFQLWTADDVDHRLQPKKLKNIIKLSKKKLQLSDQLDVEVEYQGTTIGKYQLDFQNGRFQLVTTLTDCLAKDQCGIPEEQMPQKETAGCEPNSGCC